MIEPSAESQPSATPSTSLRAHHALDVDAVDDLLDGRKDLAGEFQLAEPERAALAGRAEPAQEEAEQLPQRIEAEAAGHDRIALEVAGKEPEVRLEFEHRAAPGPCRIRRPASAISEMRSNINMGGSGSWALPAPNNSPRAHASRSSYLEACSAASPSASCPWPSRSVPQVRGKS